ncbi:MAG TPA: hypothetical protein VHX61_15765 [Rhizomicrobium sp.]|jgi:hypothetical protein|nr:hypothetical protein [Rhizomicrobium sp.]
MKTVSRGLSVTALAIVVSACAASPESIQAHNISTQHFAYLSCPQLAEYKATLTAAYTKAADTEHTARMEDAATFALGFPVGSMTHESLPWQIGDLKGRIATVQKLQVADRCDQQRQAAADQ